MTTAPRTCSGRLPIEQGIKWAFGAFAHVEHASSTCPHCGDTLQVGFLPAHRYCLTCLHMWHYYAPDVRHRTSGPHMEFRGTMHDYHPLRALVRHYQRTHPTPEDTA